MTADAVRPLLTDILLDYTIRRGCIGPFKLVGKGVRLLAHWPEHRRWLRCLDGPTTRQLRSAQPRIAFRPSALYLFRGPGFVVRMRMLGAHYAFLNAVCDEARFATILRSTGLRLWSRETRGGRLAIDLHGPPHHREGDLALHFEIDDVAIFKMAFSVLPSNFLSVADAGGRGHVICIGQVQGVGGETERIRAATRLCEAIAPQDLLMNAVAGIAAAWGITRLVGVGVHRHLSADKMSVYPQCFDYEAFWTRYHATVNDARHHVIEAPLHQRPVGEIVSRHRKRTLHKRRFKDAVTRSVASRIAVGLGAGSDGAWLQR